MTRHILFIGIMLAAAILQSVSHSQDGSLLSLLPKDAGIRGWSRVDTAKVYRGEDLFLFIDGGAELFFEYGFRQALAVEYQNAGGKSINLEIYEMNDPAASYGIYSIRSGEEATPMDIGQEGSAQPYYIMFWKGRYYVSVAGSDSTQEYRRGLEAIVRAVDHNISEQGRKSRIVELLPKENLLKRRYVRGFLGLSTIHVFDVRDMFHSAEGAIGTYGDHTLILMRYSSQKEAEQRFAEIGTILKSNERFKGYKHRDHVSTVTDEKRRILCFGLSRTYLIVTISSDESVAQASCNKATLSLGTR